MVPTHDGYLCENCLDDARVGRDRTSQALRIKRAADELQSLRLQGHTLHKSDEEVEYEIAARHLMADSLLAPDHGSNVPIGSGAEVIRSTEGGLVNTLTSPSVAALDASNARTDLLTQVGTEIAAMAVDAADSIQAANSLEKMLAHQLAAVHHAGMQMMKRAALMEDPVLGAKTLNAAMNAIKAFQGGLQTLSQLRGHHQQRIVVQHVNVNDGGRAVVGNVNPPAGDEQ